MHLILASTSPRRRQLLAELGLPFDCIPPDIDESAHVTLPPHEQAAVLAKAKARQVAMCYPEALVVGGDTLVALDGVVFGRPTGPRHAAQMLRQLQGKTHKVVTAIALVRVQPPFECTQVEVARVTMRALTSQEIADYVATGEPLDKAGAYGVQGLGGTLISQVEGDYSAVVGLPQQATAALLRRAGVSLTK